MIELEHTLVEHLNMHILHVFQKKTLHAALEETTTQIRRERHTNTVTFAAGPFLFVKSAFFVFGFQTWVFQHGSVKLNSRT